MRQSFSYLVCLLGMTLLPFTFANAGPGISGGGDECENRIKSIASDFQNWIRDGGPNALKLPAGYSADKYSRAMTDELQRARVACVGPGDQGYPVEIDGTAKTCRFDKSRTSRITCDYQKFSGLTEEQQYVLVHHEYAGLAGIEPANGDDSSYEISNQISGYLQDTIVKKLSILPVIDEKALCEKDIDAYIRAKFPHNPTPGPREKIDSVQVDKVMFIDSDGSVDIEAHALFDEYGYSAIRIFLGADAIYKTPPGGFATPAACKNFRVKAWFENPLLD